MSQVVFRLDTNHRFFEALKRVLLSIVYYTARNARVWQSVTAPLIAQQSAPDQCCGRDLLLWMFGENHQAGIEPTGALMPGNARSGRLATAASLFFFAAANDSRSTP